MAAGPNQTGSTMQAPLSAAMGYGSSLVDQVSEEEKLRRQKMLQNQGASVSPRPAVSSYLGYQTPGQSTGSLIS